MIKALNNSYELIENNKDAFNDKEFLEIVTDYFLEFDYIIGDYAYSKLRLKGFYEDSNKKSKVFNKISSKDSYIKNNCAYDCKYFILKKV